jgi:hypothetical protein
LWAVRTTLALRASSVVAFVTPRDSTRPDTIGMVAVWDHLADADAGVFEQMGAIDD